MKSSRLKLSESTTGISQYCDFDPRPAHLVQHAGYPAVFNNLCVGFQSTCTGSAPAMPILQNIPPANVYAIVNDHDYLKKHPEDMFWESFGVLSISEKEISDIERETRKQHASKAWCRERIKRLQSSNFGRICKATHKTNFDNLASSFMQTRELHTEPILHGKKYEPVAVKAYEDKHSVTTTPCGIFVSSEYPFLGFSPDRIVDENTVLEVKCPYTCWNMEITEVTVPYLKRVEGELTLSTNHDYYFQIQGQLLCTKRQHCDFVVYTLKDMKVCRIERDEGFICDMVDSLTHFFKSYYRKAILEHFLYKKSYKYCFEY